MADLVTLTFNYTGSTQTWKVPGHVPGTLTVTMFGAEGGTFEQGGGVFDNRGGYGGYITGLLNVVRGTTLTIGVGGQGTTSPTGNTSPTPGGGGPRPGGGGGRYGSHANNVIARTAAGGGGASEIKIGSTVVAVAGGGGGGGTKSGLNSGDRAGRGAIQTGSGGNGTPNSATTIQGQGGRGGTTSAVGAGGNSATDKYPTFVEKGYDGDVDGDGGDGASFIYVPGSVASGSNCGGGGGGGGGYYGAGGGGGSSLSIFAGRGGGGSSWSNGTYVTETGTASAIHTGNGFVTISYEPAGAGGIYRDGAIHMGSSTPAFTPPFYVNRIGSRPASTLVNWNVNMTLQPGDLLVLQHMQLRNATRPVNYVRDQVGSDPMWVSLVQGAWSRISDEDTQTPNASLGPFTGRQVLWTRVYDGNPTSCEYTLSYAATGGRDTAFTFGFVFRAPIGGITYTDAPTGQACPDGVLSSPRNVPSVNPSYASLALAFWAGTPGADANNGWTVVGDTLRGAMAYKVLPSGGLTVGPSLSQPGQECSFAIGGATF
jgi:hypothetical protein